MREILKSLWHKFKDSRYRQAAFLVLFIPLCLLFDPYFVSFISVVVITVFVNHLDTLSTRIVAKNSLSWDVVIDKVHVGSISDSDYAVIQKSVLSSKQVFIAQALNLLRGLFSLFNYLYLAVPLALFWMAVVILVFSPESIDALLSLENIKHILPIAGLILALTVLLLVLFDLIFFRTSRFGFINCFEQSVGNEIRLRFRIVSHEGSVVLTQHKTDNVNDLSTKGAYK